MASCVNPDRILNLFVFIGFCNTNNFGLDICQALFLASNGSAICGQNVMITNCCLYCITLTEAPVTSTAAPVSHNTNKCDSMEKARELNANRSPSAVTMPCSHCSPASPNHPDSRIIEVIFTPWVMNTHKSEHTSQLVFDLPHIHCRVFHLN